MKKIIMILGALILASTSHAQNSQIPNNPNNPDNPDNGETVNTTATPKLQEWTVMVYLNADNNLHRFGLADINEMEKVGSGNGVQIVTLFDGYEKNDSKIYLIEKDNNPNEITSLVLQEPGEVDMGEKSTLVNFVKYAKALAPAKRYALVVWNHGSGWNLKTMSGSPDKGISYDDDSGHHITTPQLGEALTEIDTLLGKKLDLYISDACLMNMVEVAYEIRDTASFMVGSEDLEPGDGLEYDRWLQVLSDKPTTTAEDLAKALVDTYVDHYASVHDDVCYSAIDLSKVGNLATPYKNWALALQNYTPEQATEFIDIIKKQKYFSNYNFKDILTSLGALPQGAEELTQLQTAVQSVIYYSRWTGSSLSFSTGLSQWLPTSKWSFMWDEAAYRQLKFSQDTGFGDALKTLYAKYIVPPIVIESPNPPANPPVNPPANPPVNPPTEPVVPINPPVNPAPPGPGLF